MTSQPPAAPTAGEAEKPDRRTLPIVPASFFGIVLGLAGLGSSWRAAHEIWHLPRIPGEALMLMALVVWMVLTTLYVLKWVLTSSDALAETRHPVQCCFVGLIGVATMLIALDLLPYSLLAGEVAFGSGAAFTLAFALWRTGLLWQGGRDPGTTTPVLYLPAVAGSFVTATVAASLGYPDWGQLAFGAGLFSWLAIESVLLHRLYTVATLPPTLRPTLGIQLAPPTVGAVAYVSVTSGPPDMLAHALIGYGLLQGLLLLRLLPWIIQQPFATSYWAFTFGATALATASLRMIERGDSGAIALIAPYLFGAANILVALIALATLGLAVKAARSRLRLTARAAVKIDEVGRRGLTLRLEP
jgi:tellurite resistance protein